MPERTIQEIHTYNSTHESRFGGRHYIEISYETWRTFDLSKLKTTVTCEINSLFDKSQNTLFDGSEFGICRPRHWYEIAKTRWHFDLIFSPAIVKSIGIREGLYVDMLLTRVNRLGGNVEEIFPKRLVYGKLEIQPKDLDKLPISTTGNLVEYSFDDSFFAKLVIEINRAFGFRLYTSTITLLRKLIENLLIEFLRTKFGTKDLDLYYWKEKGRFHDFSTLLENFESNLSSFRHYSTAFESDMITFLNKFREKANSATHSIEEKSDWNYIESLKKDLNYYCEVFGNTIKKIRKE